MSAHAGDRRRAAVAIRDAVAADLDQVATIERASFADPWSRASFASLVGDPRVHFRVAVAAVPAAGRGASSVRDVTSADARRRQNDARGEASVGEGGVVGYVVAWLVVDEAEVANIAVASEARGLGVGARLLDDALDAARRHGATTVYLEVRDSNAAARALYASRGFQQIGRRRHYYRKPVEDALVMRRELDAGAPDGVSS